MTELTFAKTFLSTLDSKPTKITTDHIEDPRCYPAHGAYILPKQARPLPKRQKLAPGSERSITVSLKSLRNPPLDITLKSLSPTTSILNLKEQVSAQSSIPIAALRVLSQKKPVPDSKILKDLVKDGEERIEFSVMVIGGTAAVRKVDEEIIPDVGSVAQGDSGKAVLAKEEFWSDLKGFLIQRLKDEKEGARVSTVFRRAWETQK